MLSKTEVLYLSGQTKVSKSYEYKVRSIINTKKIFNLLDKELPLLSSLFPHHDLITFGVAEDFDGIGITNISSRISNPTNIHPLSHTLTK